MPAANDYWDELCGHLAGRLDGRFSASLAGQPAAWLIEWVVADLTPPHYWKCQLTKDHQRWSELHILRFGVLLCVVVAVVHLCLWLDFIYFLFFCLLLFRRNSTRTGHRTLATHDTCHQMSEANATRYTRFEQYLETLRALCHDFAQMWRRYWLLRFHGQCLHGEATRSCHGLCICKYFNSIFELIAVQVARVSISRPGLHKLFDKLFEYEIPKALW